MNISKGVWEINSQNNLVKCGNKWIADGTRLGFESVPDYEVAANMRLIADAGNIAQKTGLLPMEMYCEIKEMKELLQSFVDYLDSDLTESELILKEKAQSLLSNTPLINASNISPFENETFLDYVFNKLYKKGIYGFNFKVEDQLNSIYFEKGGSYCYATPFWEGLDGIVIDIVIEGNKDTEEESYHTIIPFNLTGDMENDFDNYIEKVGKVLQKINNKDFGDFK